MTFSEMASALKKLSKSPEVTNQQYFVILFYFLSKAIYCADFQMTGLHSALVF